MRFGNAVKDLKQASSYLERAMQAGDDAKAAQAWGRLALAFTVKAKCAAGAEGFRSRPQLCQLGGS